MGCEGCDCKNVCDDSAEDLRYTIEKLKDEIEKLEDEIFDAEARSLAKTTEFFNKVADLLDFRLVPIEDGKEYLLIYKLEDILKEYRDLKGKLKGGETSASEALATKRTPDDRNCSSAG